MLAIWGAKGNMGRRYVAIAKYLKQEVVEIDVDSGKDILSHAVKECSHHIVASNTNQHVDVISSICNFRGGFLEAPLYVLCEKPVAFATEKILDALIVCSKYNILTYVVNQYLYLPEYSQFAVPSLRQPTFYDYFFSGNDGIAFDCVSILGLAQDIVSLQASSPVWNLIINGVAINKTNMDMAYVKMVDDFLHTRTMLWNFQNAIESTKKAIEYSKSNP